MKPEEVVNIRLSKNWSQIQFAQYVGVTQATISRWENGGAAIRGPALKIIKSLGKGKVPRSCADEAGAAGDAAGAKRKKRGAREARGTIKQEEVKRDE